MKTVVAFVLALLVTGAAHAAGYAYAKSGAPIFPNFKLHVTTYDQIRAALGPPIKTVNFDAEGNPEGAAFLIPAVGAAGGQAWQCVFIFGEHAKYYGVTCNRVMPAAGSK